MDQRLRLVLMALQPGVNVRALCAREAVSPAALYGWRRRYLAGGAQALTARSRRPHRSPNQIPTGVEDQIVRLRKELVDAGLDAGPVTIRWHLDRQDGAEVVPSTATISRVLSRWGLVSPQPQKRPKSSWRRFEWPHPNDLWQGDMTQWTLADGTEAEIIDFLDDHSRYVPALVAFDRPVTCEDTTAVFEDGCRAEGAPTRLVTDNGLIFTGNQLGFEVSFQTRVRALGVHQIHSSPYHPQTCGKLERFHQTLKKHLRAQDPATLVELQTQLDAFRGHYNHHRPHQGIGRTTPAARYHAQPRSGPLDKIPDKPPHIVTGTVSSAGHLSLGGRWRIGVGTRWAHTRVTIIQTGLHVQLYDPDNRLIRELDLDPSRRYQPTGNTPGPKPRHR